MKHFTFYFYLIALLLGIGTTQAGAQAEVSPYKFEFSGIWSNTAISGTVTYPTVGNGWGRYWEEGSGTTGRVAYVRNTGTANNHTSTGAIASSVAVSQTSNTRHDMLVTPLVKGNVTLWAKKYGTSAAYTGRLRFFALDRDEDEDGVYYLMQSLTPVYETTLAGTTYEQIQFNVADYSYIGIEGQYCYFDDFQADYAKVDLQDKLTITSVSNANNPASYDDADAEGNVHLKFYFYVRNDGDRDLTGDMKVRVYSSNGFDKTVDLGEKTLQIGNPLQVGTNAAPQVDLTFKYDEYPDPADYYAIVSVNGVETEPWRLYNRVITPNPYGPKAQVVANNNQYAIFQNTQDVVFQPDKTGRTITFRVNNTGTAPLEFSDIVVPEGFSTNLTTSTRANAHNSTTFTLTATDNTVGSHEGVFSFKTNGGDFVWNLKYQIADGFCENFETTSNPSYLLREGTGEWASTTWARYYNTDDNQNAMQHASTKEGKLLLPLMQVEEGDVFSFQAARVNKTIQTVDGEKVYPSPTNSNVKVYYSTDRANWTLAKTVGSSELPTQATEYSNSLYYHFGTYTLEGLPAGQYYLAITGDSIFVDNLYGKVGYKQVEQLHNMAVVASILPTEGQVNSVFKASATIANGTTTIEPATYSAKLYFGDQVVGEAEPVQIAASYANGTPTTARVAFSLTPHQAGTYQAHIEIVTEDGYVVKSPNVELTIAAESGTLDVPVGENSLAYDPLGNGQNLLELVYPASMLGLKEGTEIKSIAFKGYVGVGSMGTTIPTTYDMKMYVGSTEATSLQAADGMATTDGLTLVMDKEVQYEFGNGAGGYDSSVGRQLVTESVDMIRANLATPIIYDGKGLHILLEATRTAAGTVGYLETDHTITDKALYKGAYSAEQFATATPVTRQLPVLYLGVESDATYVTGTVTNQQGAPVEGVAIDLQSNDDDVDYKATTDAEGKYSLQMFRVGRNFHQRVEKVGYYPQDTDFDVTGNLVKDVQLVDATGLFIENSTLPAGEVNSLYTATARVSNFTAAAITADQYTATLYVDGKPVATATAADVTSLAYETLSLSYTPHQAGTFPAYITIEHQNGTVAQTVPVSITIGEEVNSTVHQLGTPSSPTANTSGVFTYTSYTHAAIELYYTEAELQEADIQVGDIIRGITVKGWANQSVPAQFNTRIYMQHTSNTTPTWTSYNNFTLNDTTAMTKAYEGVITVEAKGSSSELADYYVLPLSEGFVYQGGNITLTVATDGLTSQTANAWFLYDKNGNQNALYAYQYSNSSTSFDRAYRTQRAVLFLDVDRFRTVGGTVTQSGTTDAVADVAITVKSGDVEYYGTTAADGTYSVKVGKFQQDYTATYEKADYDTAEQTVSFATGNQTVDAQLVPIRTVSGVVTRQGKDTPVEGVSVTLQSGDETLSTTTAADGSYSLKVYNFGVDYTATFAADSYDTAQQTVSFAEGSQTLNVALAAYRTLTGVVTIATDNVPAAGVTITLTNAEGTHTATTADDGSYAFKLYSFDTPFTATIAAATNYGEYTSRPISLEEGSQVLNIDLMPLRNLTGVVTIAGEPAEGLTVVLKNEDVEYTATTAADGSYGIVISNFLSPLVATVTADFCDDYASEPISFTEGDQVLNIDLTPYRTLTGTVTAGGQPLAGVVVTVTLTNYQAQYTTTTAADGTYSINVYKWDTSFQATYEADGYGKVYKTVLLTEPTQELNIDLTAYRTLSGVVTLVGSGEPVAEASVVLAIGEEQFTTTTTAEGAYSFKLYDFSQTATVSVSAFECDDYTSEALSLAEGNQVKNIELTPYRTLTGTVTRQGKDTPVEGVSITLQNATETLTTATAADGSYSLKVYNFQDAFTATYSAEGYETLTQTISLAESSQVVNVELVAYRTLTGTVTDSETKAVLPGVTVTLTDGTNTYTATSAADGSYQLTAYEFDGTFTATFEAAGYEPATKTVSLAQNLTNVLNVELRSYTTVGITAGFVPGGSDYTVFTTSGRLVGRNVNLKSLKKGVYLINGQKYVVK